MWLWISEYGCGRMWLPNVARRSQSVLPLFLSNYLITRFLPLDIIEWNVISRKW